MNRSHYCTSKNTQKSPETKIKDEVKIKIDNIAFGGEGVGRIEDFVVFVPLVIEGEEVEVDDADVKSSCADCERGMDVAVKTNDSLELAPRRLRGAEKSAEHDDALAALTCAFVQA